MRAKQFIWAMVAGLAAILVANSVPAIGDIVNRDAF